MKKEQGITLIALVVTVVVLLILAGVSILVLFGDKGIFQTTEDATTKFGIEAEREKIENVRIDWWTKKVKGENVTVEEFFKMLQPQIIENREQDVTGPDQNNTYIVETNSGYTVEISIDENGNIQIGEIAKGNLNPRIRDIKISTTENSITAKANVVSANGKTINYEYKLETEPDSSYKLMTATEEESYMATGLIANASYKIRVTIIPTEPLITEERTVIARDTSVKDIKLNKTEETLDEGKTLQLIATIEPDYAENKNVIWTSSDIEVAEVNKDGVVTANKIGTTTITATAEDQENKVDTCTITVIEAESDWGLISRIAKDIATRTDIDIDSNTQKVAGKTKEGESYEIEVGDTFKVRYNEETILRTVRVIGFKHDELVDKTIYKDNEEDIETVDKAGITFKFVDHLISNVPMNKTKTDVGGWAQSYMRERLAEEYLKLSNNNNIKEVKKLYMTSKGYDEDVLSTINDGLFLLSHSEIWERGPWEQGYNKELAREGKQYKFYKQITNDIDSETDNPKISQEDGVCWLRSFGTSWASFCCVSDGGKNSSNAANETYYAKPGFCI